MSDEAPNLRPALKPCPICAKPAVQALRPFCSKRCADIDLNRWFTGAYAIPAAQTDEDEEEQESSGLRASIDGNLPGDDA